MSSAPPPPRPSSGGDTADPPSPGTVPVQPDRPEVRQNLAHLSDQVTPEERHELFFAFSNDLYTQFEYIEDPPRVVIDLSRSHVWDASTVAALDAITEKYYRYGKTVEVVGLNAASQAMRGRLSGRLSADG